MYKLSFIICTHNPDTLLLNEVLDAILYQVSVDRSSFEIIVIDNNSSPSLDLSHHPNSADIKLVSETTPGLVAARIRGYTESNADLLIFVDDDNILASNYASIALDLSSSYPNIGVFSAGKILPRYMTEPPANIKDYWPYMALIDIDREKFSISPSDGVLPIGAGMVVRRQVMKEYKNKIQDSPNRANLDRIGNNLLAGGDTDIGIVSCELDFGCGYFPSLRLTHVMPAFRLQIFYLNNLVRDVCYSTQLVEMGAQGNISIKLLFKRLIQLFKSRLRHGNASQAIASAARFKAAWTLWKNR